MKTHNRSFPSLHSPDPFPEISIASDKVVQAKLGQTNLGQTNPDPEIVDKDYLKFIADSQKEMLELLKKIAQKF